jgi:transcriptional regulator with XRE-family HTH domain
VVDITEDNVTIGRRLRRIRLWRRKSQAVVAGLAGISEPYLSLLETGKRALNRRSLIVALGGWCQMTLGEENTGHVP